MKGVAGRWAVVAGMFLASGSPAWADKVGLKNGNVFNGRIVPGAPDPLTFIDTEPGVPVPVPRQDPAAEGAAGRADAADKIPDFVTIRLDMGGQMTIPADDIAWIEDVEDPPEEIGTAQKPDAAKGKAAAKKPPAKKSTPPKKPASPKPPAKPKSV